MEDGESDSDSVMGRWECEETKLSLRNNWNISAKTQNVKEFTVKRNR